ncbi:MAG: hypothetical protein MUE44_06525 [Oscillatoriaceae cyanobacterium Prado104]|jgi:hypothetical protein|nr:hypothetical protein [Oscillatoriaceae cyanobacterium Prado104]
MNEQRVSLYDRLPEIYRIRDEEQSPPGQLKSYLALVEAAFGAIHENIETLYHDLFIETCDDWVIPYIGDLLGTTHLKGDAWNLRADVADTIALRRRKGTLGAIVQLTYDLTNWGVHCVELRENLLWNQHLNHQRPDVGGEPPYKFATRHAVMRGGTVTLRDPAMLSLLNTPYDPFSYTADFKPPTLGNTRYNLPNLAIFLWRLTAYRVAVSKPVFRGVNPRNAAIDLSNFPKAAAFIARFEVHPLGEPVRLFNINRFNPDLKPPVVSAIDETPGPIPTARLTSKSAAGTPEKYVTVETYNPTNASLNAIEIGETGLQLHLPEPLKNTDWKFRGANLCAWENGLNPPLQTDEIAIDPVIGRIAIAINNNDPGGEGELLENNLFLTYTYGAVGPVGAHPISRKIPEKWHGEAVVVKSVNLLAGNTLNAALNNIQNETSPVVINIEDSLVHVLDLRNSAIAGTVDEDGGFNLKLNSSLIIQAADGQKPIVKLLQPLRVRPQNLAAASDLTFRLEGLYLTRDEAFPNNAPLIARAAINRLEIVNCTLDPGGQKVLDGTAEGKRQPMRHSLQLRQHYGLSEADEKIFKQTPEIILERSISGSLLIDRDYLLFISNSIIDAGKGVGDKPENSFAVASATNAIGDWGPPTVVNNITVFGRMRVENISGQGGIWVHSLEVLNNQKCCLKFSYFSGTGDRLPQNYGCVKGTAAKLRFVSEIFGQPAYAQLHATTDFNIRENGPNDDAMGAFNFLLEAHKWRNLQIRYREFMPVAIRPLFVPVT